MRRDIKTIEAFTVESVLENKSRLFEDRKGEYKKQKQNTITVFLSWFIYHAHELSIKIYNVHVVIQPWE